MYDLTGIREAKGGLGLFANHAKHTHRKREEARLNLCALRDICGKEYRADSLEYGLGTLNTQISGHNTILSETDML
jgi:hypothetical protein